MNGMVSGEVGDRLTSEWAKGIGEDRHDSNNQYEPDTRCDYAFSYRTPLFVFYYSLVIGLLFCFSSSSFLSSPLLSLGFLFPLFPLVFFVSFVLWRLSFGVS